MSIKRIQATVIAGLLLLMLILPQLALAQPEISNVVVLGTTSDTATIYWTTDSSSDSWVYYRLEDATTWDWVHDSSEVTTHTIEITGLNASETYYFWIKSIDASGIGEDKNNDAYYQFTTGPPQYRITLDHCCGVCGELRKEEDRRCNEAIRATATVATAGTYHICWDARAPWDDEKLEGRVETITATGPGSYTREFWMPEAKRGDHNVYLTDNTYAQKGLPAVFTVGTSANIEPEEGPVGTEVTVNCYGFDPSQPIRLIVDGTEVKEDTTDGDFGSWTVSYIVPDTPGGDSTFEVEVEEATAGWVCWVSKYFRVLPQITVIDKDPDDGIYSGTVGQTIAVEGTGFASEEEDIEITFDEEPMETTIPVVADDNGSWEAIIVIPPLPRGEYYIGASGESTRARDVDPVKFILGAGILVEPPGPHYVGDTVTVIGGGFRLEEKGIRVTFEGKSVATGIPADSNGSWETSFILPASTYGSNDVEASGDITKPAVSTTLDIKARIEELSVDEGYPGDSVTLTGSGFSNYKKLEVTISGITAPGEDGEPLDVRTQTNGNVNITFRVPKMNTVGERMLVVTDEGGASDSVEFTVKRKTLSTTPLPISPKNGPLRSGEVTFKWQGSTGNTGYTYTLEISKTADFTTTTSPPYEDIKETSYTLTEDEALPKGTYFWRVKIVDDYGNEGPWSDSIEFRVSPIPTWVWVVVGVVVLVGLMVVAYRETKFRVRE